MRTRFSRAVLAVALGVALTPLAGCSQIAGLKGKMAFKDANAAYQGGDYRKAFPSIHAYHDISTNLKARLSYSTSFGRAE